MPPSKADQDRLGNYAAMLAEDARIDRHLCHRIVPMEVLSLGLSRTGTMSIQQALSILGYASPYHFSSMYGNVRDADMWMEALRAKYKGQGKPFTRTEWDQLLGHVSAVTDAPANIFFAELVEAYPQAKVVLVEREIEAWFKSFDGLMTAVFNPVLTFFSYTDPLWFGRIQGCGTLWFETQLRATTLEEGRRNARQVFIEHYTGVRRVTPKERLLEYQLGSGWEPLCKFLGKAVPDVPFPHANEAKTLKTVFEEMGVKAVKNSLKNVGMIAGAVAVAGLALYWAVPA